MNITWAKGYVDLLKQDFYDKDQIKGLAIEITKEINSKLREEDNVQSGSVSYDEIDRLFTFPDCRVKLKLEERELKVIKTSFRESDEDIVVNIHNHLTGRYSLAIEDFPKNFDLDTYDSFEEAFETAMMHVLLY